MAQIELCCEAGNKEFEVTYEVAGEEKTYRVCKSCHDLECFKKFIIKKEQIDSGHGT